jgi:hypothetical protein
MAGRVPRINLDGTNGAMTRLAKSLSLLRHIKKHNDPSDAVPPESASHFRCLVLLSRVNGETIASTWRNHGMQPSWACIVYSRALCCVIVRIAASA